MAIRLNGKVLWFSLKKGYGFITVISSGEHYGENVFVHFSELSVQKSEYKYLITGEYVSFFLVESSNTEKYKYQASQVSGIDTENSNTQNPLICDSRYEEEKNAKIRFASNPKPVPKPVPQQQTIPKRIMKQKKH